MKLSGMNISRRKFLAASGGAVAAGLFASNLTNLKALAGGKDASDGSKGEQYIPSSCEMCVNKCAFIGHVVDGKVKKLNPNPKFFKSRGMLCARGNAGADEPYNPERLTKPLVRVGERGEGKWKEISYEEAFTMLAQKFDEHKKKNDNRSSVAFISSEGFQEEMFQMLVQAYGSTNTVRHPTLCLASVIQGWSAVYGVYPDADMKNCKFAIMFGANRAEAIVTPDTIDFVKYKPEGAKLIYLDPRFTNTAAKADKWYPVKPGTDLAFVLALMNVIITENIYNADFVQNYTVGFDELKAAITPYTPEWAEKETDIPAVEIRWTAREFAKAAPAAVAYPGRRTSWYVNDVYFRKACAMLTAICGCWDTPGGICQKGHIQLSSLEQLYPIFDKVEDRIDATSSVKNRLPKDKRSQGLPTTEISYMGEKDGSWLRFRDAVIAADPYKVDALVVYKQNFIEAVPNRNKTFEMLKKIDFMCTIDCQLTESAFFADLVIPESTYIERWDSVHGLAGVQTIATFRQPLVEPVFQTKSMYEIAGGVIDAMLKIPTLWDDCDPMDLEDFKADVAEDFFKKPMIEHIKSQMSAIPGGFEKLMKDGVYYDTDKVTYGTTLKPEFRFKTRSGKIELTNTKYAEKGLNPLFAYATPSQPKEGQYRFILGRHAWNTHSGTQNNAFLWELQKVNTLWINPDEAKKIGIKSGDNVKVKSSVGEQELEAFVTEKIRKDCVFYAHGFGRLSSQMSLVYKKGASQSEILEDYLEPISGNCALHETFVTVTKA